MPSTSTIDMFPIGSMLVGKPNRSEIELLFSHDIIKFALDPEMIGGFIAGGVLRKLFLREEPVFNVEKIWSESYFGRGGDIDIWFEDKRSYNDFVRHCDDQIARAKENPIASGPTLARVLEVTNYKQKHAKHYKIEYPVIVNGTLSKQKVTIQAVNSTFGKPEQILSTFDIINSAIASNGKSVWLNSEAAALEKSKILSLSETQSEKQKNLLYRAMKYISFYDYVKFDSVNDSLKILAEWCQSRLNPIEMSKYTGEDETGYAAQLMCLNNFLLTSTQDLIPNERFGLFGGIGRIPRYEPLTDPVKHGIYRTPGKDFVQNGEVDAAIGAWLYRQMIDIKKEPPKSDWKLNDILESNPFGYGTKTELVSMFDS